jgi:hypothetical protein
MFLSPHYLLTARIVAMDSYQTLCLTDGNDTRDGLSSEVPHSRLFKIY